MAVEYPIIKAELRDLDELHVLEELAFARESFSKKQLRYLLTKAKGDYQIIRVEGELAASLILLKKKNSFYLRIYSILVSPKFRGLGLAKQLLNYAEKQVVGSKLKGLSLEVSEKNTAAVKLYLSSGFQTVSEKIGYYKDGSKALVMRKEVQTNND